MEEMNKRFMREVCIVCFLGISSWTDIKKRKISLPLCAGVAATGIFWMIRQNNINWECLVRAGIVCFLTGVSILSRGALGMGDVCLVLALGTVTFLEEFIVSLTAGMLLSAVYSMILLTVFHKSRKTEIPFAPFLLAGYIGGLFL